MSKNNPLANIVKGLIEPIQNEEPSKIDLQKVGESIHGMNRNYVNVSVNHIQFFKKDIETPAK